LFILKCNHCILKRIYVWKIRCNNCRKTRWRRRIWSLSRIWMDKWCGYMDIGSFWLRIKDARMPSKYCELNYQISRILTNFLASRYYFINRYCILLNLPWNNLVSSLSLFHFIGRKHCYYVIRLSISSFSWYPL
jgi:hypothetical protein